MQFTTIAPLADFPRDPQPSSTDALKDARDLICHTAASMSLGGCSSTRKELCGVMRSASGHSFGRVGEYAAVRFGSEMRGVTVIVRPSQVEIVAIERKQIDADTVQVVRCAKSYGQVTRQNLEHDLHLRVDVMREAVRLFDSMEAV